MRNEEILTRSAFPCVTSHRDTQHACCPPILYVCMYVFNDRERTDCPKKTILGEVDKTHREELSTDALFFLCFAHTPYGTCTYRSPRYGLAQYIHTRRAYLSGFRPAQAPHRIGLLYATMTSCFRIQWQALFSLVIYLFLTFAPPMRSAGCRSATQAFLEWP